MADQTKIEDSEVRRNYEAFVLKLPELLAERGGMYALMHDAEIVEFFDTPGDAFRAGRKLYQDLRFSIQQVIDAAANPGFFSHALP